MAGANPALQEYQAARPACHGQAGGFALPVDKGSTRQYIKYRPSNNFRQLLKQPSKGILSL